MKRYIRSTIVNYYDTSVQKTIKRALRDARREVEDHYAICVAALVSDKRRDAAGIFTNIGVDVAPNGYLFIADSPEEYEEKVAKYLGNESARDFRFYTVYNRDHDADVSNFSLTSRILQALDPMIASSDNVAMNVSEDKIILEIIDSPVSLEQFLRLYIFDGDDYFKHSQIEDDERWMLISIGEDAPEDKVTDCLNFIQKWIGRYS